MIMALAIKTRIAESCETRIAERWGTRRPRKPASGCCEESRGDDPGLGSSSQTRIFLAILPSRQGLAAPDSLPGRPATGSRLLSLGKGAIRARRVPTRVSLERSRHIRVGAPMRLEHDGDMTRAASN